MTATTAAPAHPGMWEALLGGSRQGSLYAWEGNGYTRTPWAEASADALGMAATLRAAGVRPGARVAALLDNTPHAVRGLVAVWMAGGTFASLPLPARGVAPEEYGRQLTVLLDQLDPQVLLLDERFLPLVPPEVAASLPVLTWTSLPSSGRIEPSPPGLDEVAFVQYSSGSTSVPKGCALTTRAIAQHLGMMLEMCGSRPGRETIACWLPLSHDMGVFGCLVNCWAYDFDLLLSTPERFAMAPRSWFRDMSEFEATMSAGTSTALYLATRAQNPSTPLPKPLQLRTLVLGAERVDADAIVQAGERFGPSGLRPEAFVPAYGMAEATLAITCSPWTEAPTLRSFDGVALLEGRVEEAEPGAPRAVPMVGNGPPLPGVTVVADHQGPDGGGPDGGGLPEIRISSPSLASGYYRDPERTAERFHGGQLHTRDLGFLHEGELYVAGRADDVISVGGRKIYSSEIESALDSLGSLRKGCSVLVDVAGSAMPELVLLAEPRRRSLDFRSVADQAAALTRSKAGVALAECWFLEVGAVPRTPSGKVQRYRCRELLSEDRLKTIARVRLD